MIDFSEELKELEKSSQELKPIFTERPKNTTAQSKYNSNYNLIRKGLLQSVRETRYQRPVPKNKKKQFMKINGYLFYLFI